MARKRKPEAHANHERWLVSYADFITLLFAFFTTLYAISTVDTQKMGKMVYSLHSAFRLDFFPTQKAVLGHSSPEKEIMEKQVTRGARPREMMYAGYVRPRDTGPRGAEPLEGEPQIRSMRALAERIERMAGDRGLSERLRVRLEPRGLVVTLAEAGFFPSGSAAVQAESLPALDALAGLLAETAGALRVEGHSDDRPIRTLRYPSNWELSTARAAWVVQYLVERHGFAPDRIAASGYGHHRPLDPAGTPEARARNRRVDIVVLAEAAASQEP